MKEITEKEAFEKLAALCARGEHSSGDMVQKMRRWGVDEAAQARVMQRLIELKYVDDERFSRMFVRDKLVFNKWGRRKIAQALWQKGIDEPTAKAALDEVDEADYVAVLRPLLRQKSRSVSGKTEYECRQKLMRFALGRGFDFAVIRQCMDVSDLEADD